MGASSPVARRIVMAGSGVCAFAVMHGPTIAWFWSFVVALVRSGRLRLPLRNSWRRRARRYSSDRCCCSLSRSQATFECAPPWGWWTMSTNA